jgi:tungstate transport system substrate-binding protein
MARLKPTALLAVATLALSHLAAPAAAQDKSIVMASTTSTEQSGLFKVLLPAFKQATGIDVRVVAVGTGQAIDTARRGDADVLFVHDTAKEEKFVADGFAAERRDVMYNDFVLVGPKADPAKVRGKSGTHAAELRLWKVAGIDVDAKRPVGYKACGCGMGQALNLASSVNAYVLTDRATWLAFKNRGDLGIVVEGDKRLFNQYGVMVVSRAKHPHVKADLAQQFADWVVSAAGQKTIGEVKINGEQLFFANAKR